ncbi:hypothetical protein OESDEN_05513 [Oesophagostomum dentatum]|uniref:Uncharacterized protein n=1 Tax=Oesophagostomum dentatum TaxID=61180 RepID=A0A0B1TGN0_OESDE|nr:hypothetical protein OESDEN_05513 [Oesophagostomum dentatum]
MESPLGQRRVTRQSHHGDLTRSIHRSVARVELAADPAIKVIPPCRIRAHPSSSQNSVAYEPTPPNSNNSGHMLVDPIPRPEQVGSVIGLTPATEDSHLINNFSPPLTTSSRSSVALDATPPLSSGGGGALGVKQEHTLNGPSTNNFNALVNAAVVQASELTNHNRLGVASSYAPDVNGHHDEKVGIDPAALSSGALTPNAAKVAAVKRARDAKPEIVDKAKRPRTNHRTKSEKALRDLVGPIVSETVSDFHRERVADRTVPSGVTTTVAAVDRRMVTTNAVTPSTSHDAPPIQQAPIVNAAVVPPQAQPPPPTASLVSPHHSPIVPASSSVPMAAVGPAPPIGPGGSGVEDSLTQLRSLASGTPRPSVRPPSQASSVPSTSSFTSAPPGGAGFVPHVQNRTTANVSAAPQPSVATVTLTTPPSTSQPAGMPPTTSAAVVGAELAANISPERLAALNPLINGGFLGRGANQMLGAGNAMDPLITQFLLSQAQHSQQQYLAGNSTANLLARFMMPPISGTNTSVQGAGGIGK